jgi:hypothetical protein
LSALFPTTATPNKTDAGNGSKAICRVSDVLRSPSPDPKRSLENNMKYSFFLFSLIISVNHALHGQTPKVEAKFHIEKCDSGIDYPTDGNESVDVKHGNHSFHVRIYHPKVIEGPHFSSPFFWISDQDDGLDFESFITVRSHVGGLSWHSADGYFFAEKEGALRGFFLEDGFDNADNGSSGLLFLRDKGQSSAWRWSYVRPASEKKGHYEITDANDTTKILPDALLKRIAPILDHAEHEAGAWPGP